MRAAQNWDGRLAKRAEGQATSGKGAGGRPARAAQSEPQGYAGVDDLLVAMPDVAAPLGSGGSFAAAPREALVKPVGCACARGWTFGQLGRLARM